MKVYPRDWPEDSFPIKGMLGLSMATGTAGDHSAEMVSGLEGVWVNFDDENDTAVLFTWADLLEMAYDEAEAVLGEPSNQTDMEPRVGKVP